MILNLNTRLLEGMTTRTIAYLCGTRNMTKRNKLLSRKELYDNGFVQVQYSKDKESRIWIHRSQIKDWEVE